MTKNGSLHRKLTPRQEGAILALLSAGTMGAAAAVAKVGEKTLYRWLKDPAFQEAYREARREVVSQAVARLQQACGEAVETLRGVMQDLEAPASAKVSAAKTILEMSVKAVELEELSARLKELERNIEEREQRLP